MPRFRGFTRIFACRTGAVTPSFRQKGYSSPFVASGGTGAYNGHMRKMPTWSIAWRRLRLAVFARDGYRCRACGKAGILECDHLVPIQAGGGDGMENLQTLCRGCHIAKTARERRPAQPRTPEQRRYRQLVEDLL